MNFHWVLHRSGNWHAWPPRGLRSMCGTVTLDDLRVTPAQRIANTLPNGATLCGSCSRRLGPLAPATCVAGVSSSVGEWLGFLRRHLKRAGVDLARRDEIDLAERLTTLGPPSSAEARAAFDYIRELLLTPRYNRRAGGRVTQKVTRLRETLALLPPDPQALAHVVAAMRAWRQITGRAVERATRFRPDTVVATMLEIPAPEAYIRHLHAKGLTELAMIFHPNTLARHKGDASLRGLFGGSAEYWERTAAQLAAQVVSDDDD